MVRVMRGESWTFLTFLSYARKRDLTPEESDDGDLTGFKAGFGRETAGITVNKVDKS